MRIYLRIRFFTFIHLPVIISLSLPFLIFYSLSSCLSLPLSFLLSISLPVYLSLPPSLSHVYLSLPVPRSFCLFHSLTPTAYSSSPTHLRVKQINKNIYVQVHAFKCCLFIYLLILQTEPFSLTFCLVT